MQNPCPWSRIKSIFFQHGWRLEGCQPKIKSAAIVPIAVRREDSSGAVAGIVQTQAEADGGKKDAYSTFGNFTLDSRAQAAEVSVGLGRFLQPVLLYKRFLKNLVKHGLRKLKRIDLRYKSVQAAR